MIYTVLFVLVVFALISVWLDLSKNPIHPDTKKPDESDQEYEVRREKEFFMKKYEGEK